MPFESTAERHVQLLFDQVSFVAVWHQLCDKEHTQLRAGWIVSSRNIVLFLLSCLDTSEAHWLLSVLPAFTFATYGFCVHSV